MKKRIRFFFFFNKALNPLLTVFSSPLLKHKYLVNTVLVRPCCTVFHPLFLLKVVLICSQVLLKLLFLVLMINFIYAIIWIGKTFFPHECFLNTVQSRCLFHMLLTLAITSCVLAAFALLFASVLALFLLWMKIQCWDPLLFWEPCLLPCKLSSPYYMPRMHVSSAAGNTCFQSTLLYLQHLFMTCQVIVSHPSTNNIGSVSFPVLFIHHVNCFSS